MKPRSRSDICLQRKGTHHVPYLRSYTYVQRDIPSGQSKINNFYLLSIPIHTQDVLRLPGERDTLAMKTTIIHSNCPWTTTKNTMMLRKNISGLSLRGGLSVWALSPLIMWWMRLRVSCQPCITQPVRSRASPFTLMPEFRQRPWGEQEEEAASVLPKCTVEARSDPTSAPLHYWVWISPPWRNSFPKIYEFQENWPAPFKQPHWTCTVLWTFRPPELPFAQRLRESRTGDEGFSLQSFSGLGSSEVLLSLVSMPKSPD